MTLDELITAELSALSTRMGRKDLRIVETGSIRADTDRHAADDGWSTLTFARHVAEHGGTFTSIDLEACTARTVLDRFGMLAHVDLIQGHSLCILSSLIAAGDCWDLALLDSANDAELTMQEYRLLRPAVDPAGVVMVDDVDLDSTEVVKGHQLVPWLRDQGICHRIVPRAGVHYATGVLVIDH